MTPAELKTFLDLTEAIAQHKQALDEATKAKQQLAHALYLRYGPHAVYRIGEGDQQQDLMVARTKTATYYFAPRVRYPKESRMAKAEKKRLDRAARLQTFPTQASIPRPKPTESPPSHHDATTVKHRLPIVGDVERPLAPPEPRLLEIREPSGALLGDVPDPMTAKR